MAVMMINEVIGATPDMAKAMGNAGIFEAMATYPGFVRHQSGFTDTGLRVVEVWDDREAHQNWLNEWILPNLPPARPLQRTSTSTWPPRWTAHDGALAPVRRILPPLGANHG